MYPAISTGATTPVELSCVDITSFYMSVRN
jgi:hypothetical protein